MWQFIEVPPLPFGQCSICARHTCGEYTDEHGVKRQKWADVPIELDKGGNLVIGYQCIKSLSDDAGVTVRVVEKEVIKPATDDDILRVFRQAHENTYTNATNMVDMLMGNEIGSTKAAIEKQDEQAIQKRRGRASK